MIDIVGVEANALATEIYHTLCSVTRSMMPTGAEGEQVKDSVIRCIRKLEETLEIPQDKRFPQ